MASVKEIQTRMKSIQDTMKITNAMYMISSTKLRKAKKKLEDTEPFFYGIQSAIGRILRHVPDIESRYFDERFEKGDERKIGYIIVTADKGMAGAYTHNIMKLVDEALARHKNHRLFVLGELGRQYFAKTGEEVDTQFHYTVQNPTMHRARMISERVVELYNRGELDEIYLIYTKMMNVVTAEPDMLRLLPLKRAAFTEKIPLDIYQEEFVLMPSAKVVMENIIPNYVSGVIYGALVESYSSEQNSRMMAMEAATKSAKEMLGQLSIEYNRARQAAITQEITEVVGGAKAQKKKKR